MSKLGISGFTIVRNVISLGYPFIESVRSALPVCDEFIISEGYSSDRTWEAVQALAEKFPDKIRIRRDRWTDAADDGEVIARISNLALGDCRGDHCLYLQANEVLHEDSVDALSSFPRRFRGRVLFPLPFYNLLGKDRLWLCQNRTRMFRRAAGVCVTGDGYDVGFCPGNSRFRKWALRARKNWTAFCTDIGISEAYDCSVFPSAIFRYRCLWPANYLRKIEVRRAMAGEGRSRALWDEEWEAANQAAGQSGKNPELFWSLMDPFFEASYDAHENAKLSSLPRLSRIGTCPAIMRDIGGGWEYDFDRSLEGLAKA